MKQVCHMQSQIPPKIHDKSYLLYVYIPRFLSEILEIFYFLRRGLSLKWKKVEQWHIGDSSSIYFEGLPVSEAFSKCLQSRMGIYCPW